MKKIIDETLARGLMNRYMRELSVDAVRLRNALTRTCQSTKPTCESRVRAIDRLFENNFSQYVISKLIVLDKKRSLFEALLILPSMDEHKTEMGAFVPTLLRVNCSDAPLMLPLRMRASFHWTMRVFQRRGGYDPQFVRQEFRSALIGLSAIYGSHQEYEEIPSLEGVSLIHLSDDMAETITYMTDAQSSTSQDERWSQMRQRLATNLGLSNWQDVIDLIQRVNWVGVRKGRTFEMRPKIPWHRTNGQAVVAQDYAFADLFAGVIWGFACFSERDLAPSPVPSSAHPRPAPAPVPYLSCAKIPIALGAGG